MLESLWAVFGALIGVLVFALLRSRRPTKLCAKCGAPSRFTTCDFCAGYGAGYEVGKAHGAAFFIGGEQ